jgi:predicted regulator of Ras-like GTPase activity (Roadblock/LC7/MglB family)
MNETKQVEEIAVIEVQELKDDITQTNEIQDCPEYTKLLETLQELRKLKDVVGYILRSDSNATVDLNDPSKIIEYAMLSSQSIESSKTLAEAFKLGETENIFIEGKKLNVLCLVLGQNTISLFLEKGNDHNSILKALVAQVE